ncbi:hypothetical protein LTR67_006742 [Exophiala xenobiotica]|jgi:hypothetical protein
MDDSTAQPPSEAHREALSHNQQELGRIVKAFRIDPMGGISLGKDGVLRSLTADRDVVDAMGLPPRLIKAYLDQSHYVKELEDEFRGVDGTKVPREQWFRSDRRLLPQPLSKEHKEEARRMMEENASLTEDISQEETCCVATVRSNYNLGITG